MKNLTLIILLSCQFAICQDYKIGKIITNGLDANTYGLIHIKHDSIITILYDSQETEQLYNVNLIGETNGLKEYLGDKTKNDQTYNVRFLLSEPKIYKKYPFQLTMDTVDEFNGQTTQIIFSIAKME